MAFPKHSKPRKKPIKIHKIIRESVISRDEGLCQICFKVAVDTHHILTKAHMGNNNAQNLICVCRHCHDMIHKDEKKWFKILLNKQKEHYPHLTKQDLKRR